MKKNNLLLGASISLGIALVAIMPMAMRGALTSWQQLIANVALNSIYTFYCWIAHFYLMQQKSFKRVIGSAFLYGACSIILVALLAYPYNYLIDIFDYKVFPMSALSFGLQMAGIAIKGTFISGMIYFIVYYLHVAAEKQESLLEIEHLKQAQLQANLSSLKEQLSPHFLFNTLNTLTTLTHEQPVKDFVDELANVYRYVLQYHKNDIATLQEELDFIDSYLYILKTRLEKGIEIDIAIDATVLQSRIPPLTLQLLIENAVKHNVVAGYKPLRIILRNEGKEAITVSNNYQPKKSVEHSTGTGLNNITQRYRLLFGRDIEIEQTPEFFTVKLPVV